MKVKSGKSVKQGKSVDSLAVLLLDDSTLVIDWLIDVYIMPLIIMHITD